MTGSSSAQTVAVTFAVTFNYLQFHDETELAAAGPALMTRLQATRNPEGALQIALTGQPTVRILDELAPWMQNLCLRAVPALVAGEPYRVLYFSQQGYLDLSPQGQLVGLKGDLTPDATFPRLPLARALVECAERFLAFASRVKAGDAAYMANIDHIRRFLPPAHRALAGQAPG
jgi:hypothetical protein